MPLFSRLLLLNVRLSVFRFAGKPYLINVCEVKEPLCIICVTSNSKNGSKNQNQIKSSKKIKRKSWSTKAKKNIWKAGVSIIILSRPIKCKIPEILCELLIYGMFFIELYTKKICPFIILMTMSGHQTCKPFSKP